jgi:hypothetical protein
MGSPMQPLPPGATPAEAGQIAPEQINTSKQNYNYAAWVTINNAPYWMYMNNNAVSMNNSTVIYSKTLPNLPTVWAVSPTSNTALITPYIPFKGASLKDLQNLPTPTTE